MICLTTIGGFAQKPKTEIDINRYPSKPFHMGFTILGSYGRFKINPVNELLLQDSLQSIRSMGFPGFGLGGIANVRMGKYFDFRLLPQLHFNNRNVEYTFNDRIDKIQVESVSFDLPILVKYKSERHSNKRLYVIGGVRLSHDFAALEDKDRGPNRKIVALKQQSISYEFGFGFDIYTHVFKFSPEIKMTNSINNMISQDPYLYNGSIGFLQTRLLQISFHFE